MTAVCPGGGASQSRPGVDSSIQFNGTQVAAALAITGEEELAAIVAVVTSGTVLATDLYCSSDPPPSTTLTDQDFADAKNPLNPGAFTTAVGRIKDWFLNWYWYQICECTGATTPAAPPITLPTGTGTGTSLPTGTTSTPCWQTSFPSTVAASGGTVPTETWKDVTSLAFPLTTSVSISGPNAAITTALAIPSGVTSIQWSATWHTTSVNGIQDTLNIGTYPSAGSTGPQTRLASGGISADATTQSGTFAIPAGENYWNLYFVSEDTVAHDWDVSISFLCSGQGPNVLQVPCCPPDPLIQNYLQLILNIVQNLYTSPAGAPSTSWTPGVVHAGLSGTGSFALAKGVTAVRAQFTTIPPSIRITPGTPTFYWDLGFVTPTAASYPLRSLRTVFQTQDMPFPVQADGADYTFPAGVVVTLTELLPA